jgi:hypothetical protein
MSTQPVVVDNSDIHNVPPPGTPGGASADTTDPTPVVSPSKIDPEDVPEFERPAAANVQLNPGNEPSSIAHVDPNNPNPNLSVDTPNRYSASVQAHELTHNIQNAAGSSNPVNTQQAPKTQADIDAVYGYGGTDGLEKVMQSGGISKLNDEQQASIPQTYMKEYVKAEKAGDAKAIDRLNQVYGPAIQQLKNMANPSKTTINTTPAAPGPPPAALTGLAKPVPGMASRSTRAVDLKDIHNAPVKKKDTNGR